MSFLKRKLAWKILLPIFLALFFLSFFASQTLRAPWYEQWAWSVLSPATSFLAWVKGGTSHLWRHYFDLVNLSFENEALQKEVRRLRQSLNRLKGAEEENKRFAELLALKQRQWPRAVAASVIAFDPRSEFRTIRINKGSQEGIQPNLPVIAIPGLVGKVGPVFRGDALVLLVVDPASNVDVVIQRSGLRAILSGSGLLKHARLKHGYFLTHLEYVKKESDVAAGDAVVTSGMDRLYPPGILVGTVESITKDRYGLFLEAKVLPAVDFSKLREVFVLKE